MRITYELNVEDHLNAASVLSRGEAVRGRRRIKPWMGWLSVGLFVIVSLGGGSMALSEAWHSEHGDLTRIADRIAEPAPWVVLGLVAPLCLIATKTRRSAGIALICVALVVVAVAATFVLRYRTSIGETGWIPWFALFLACEMAFFQTIARGRNLRRAWETLKHLHGERQLNLGDGRLVIADALTTHSYDLQAIRAWSETSTQFLVFVGGVFHMVPKRAFCDNQAIEDFRREMIQATTKTPRGFQVIASATPHSDQKDP